MIYIVKMETLKRLIRNEVIDIEWNTINMSMGYLYYNDDTIIEFETSKTRTHAYTLKNYNTKKYISCHNNLYYEIEYPGEHSNFYIYYNGNFLIVVSCLLETLLCNNNTFIYYTNRDENVFVYYYCDEISESSEETLLQDIEPLERTILFDKVDIKRKVIFTNNTNSINSLYTTVKCQFVLSDFLEYIIKNYNDLDDVFYIIYNGKNIDELLYCEDDCMTADSYVSIDEKKNVVKGTVSNNHIICGTNSLKHFWIKTLKKNIPPKGLIYYNSDVNCIITKDTLLKNTLDYYKNIYSCKNNYTMNNFETYLTYTMEKIINS